MKKHFISKRRAQMLLPLLMLLLTFKAFAQNPVPKQNWLIPNGSVKSIVEDTGKGIVYMGGGFTSFMVNKPYGAVIDAGTGLASIAVAAPNASVFASVPDGSGGWYIGGSFTMVGSESRNRLAHINSNGEVTGWNPGANSDVYTIALKGNTVYVAGNFTVVAGQGRNRIAAIDASSGVATAWDPNANNWVQKLFIDDTTVYVGGVFTEIGNQVRMRVAGISINTGLPTSWHPEIDGLAGTFAKAASGNLLYIGGEFTSVGTSSPYFAQLDTSTGIPDLSYVSPNGSVLAAVPDGLGGWYIGGNFTSVGGQLRNRLAQINSSGQVTSWNPDADNTVNTIVKDNGILYVGGNFSTIGGQPRNRIAAIHAVNGSLISWDPNINGTVNSIIVNGNTVYAGGNFSTVGGQLRNRLAAIDITTASVTSWDPNVNGTVLSMSLVGSSLYIGGVFSTVGGQSRNRLASVDISSGTIASWNPNANNAVISLVANGGIIYIGGAFTTIGGQTRNRIAAIDLSSGLTTNWNPNATGTVRVVRIAANSMFVGGDFTTIGGQARDRVAKIDLATGSVQPWNANANATVNTIAVGNGSVYLGGSFTGFGTPNIRQGLAAFDVSTGQLSGLDLGLDGPVTTSILNGDTLLIGGDFNIVLGQARSKLASISLLNGQPTNFSPGTMNSKVNSISLVGTTLYVAGNFTSIGGQSRNLIASFDLTSGLLTSWDPNISGGSNSGWTVVPYNGKIYVGGSFYGLNNITRNRLAAIDANTGALTSWDPNADNDVESMVRNGNTIYIGGQFSTVGGQSRNRIASINATNGVVSNFNPNVTGTNVRKLLFGNGKLYVGGDFSAIGGQIRNNLAAINSTSGAATSWNPDVNNWVNAMAFSGSNLYIGGRFVTIGGIPRNYIALVNLTTGAPASWNPGAGDYVQSLAVASNTLFVGGEFNMMDGQSRNRLASFDINTGVLNAWDPNADSRVYSIAVKGSKVCVGGQFNTIGGQTYQGIAAIDANSGVASPWDPGVSNGDVRTISFVDTSIYVGGDFTQIGTQTHPYLGVFDVCSKAPKKPGIINQSGGVAKICPGETRSYSVAEVANAYAYNWTVPSGASISSGQGTSVVLVAFNGAYPALDTIKVIAQSDCGTSPERFIVVRRSSTPAIPTAVTGENYGLCTQSAIAYSTTNTPDITYAWSFSNANGAVATGQGTNAITANFTPGAASTVLSVTAANGCGTSNPRNKTIYAKPARPISITGSSAVCAHASGVPYSTPSVYGATSYTWKAPAGSHVSDGMTTSTGTSLTTASTSVTVNFGASAGDVQVRANNSCGSSAFFFHPVSMNCRTINGVEEAISSSDISLYPNPASDQVTLSFTAERVGEYTIHIYDVIGKEVLTTTGTAMQGANQVDLNTSGLAAGVYHVVLKGIGLDYNSKLVLDK